MGKEENALQGMIIDHLAYMRIECWRQNNHAVPICWKTKRGWVMKGWRKDKYHRKGKGDISGILPDGRRLEIECKAEDGTESAEQKDFAEMIRKNNGVYFCVYSWLEYETLVVPVLKKAIETEYLKTHNIYGQKIK